MCKKAIFLFLALMISTVALTACNSGFSDSDMNIYERIHAYYNKMECYSAKVTFSCYSNKTENQYTAIQKAMGNHRYYMKVSTPNHHMSVTTICDGQNTTTLTEGSDYSVTVPSSDTTSLLFLNHFFQTYYASEDTVVTVNGAGEGNATILETAVPKNNTAAATMFLSVDNKTLEPVRLMVYDTGGKVMMSAEFSEFCYNDKSIKESDFTTD